MTLLTKKYCPFCPPNMKDNIRKMGGEAYDVIRHPDGSLFVEMSENKFVPLPTQITGLPALICDTKIYIGQMPIDEFISSRETIDGPSI